MPVDAIVPAGFGIVDRARYPLDRLGSPEGRVFLERTRGELAARGGCRLPGFLTPEGLACCLAEAEAVAPLARHSNSRYTP
ncbi:MAG: hypothetical protein FJX36_06630 [Alphaproteobacteria bacterium]|nr:hypothetical protein [Alphaproteobacteria bacterium]